MEAAEIRDRRPPPDGRKLSVIAIAEALAGFAGQAPQDIARGVCTHLLRRRRDARHALHGREVTHDEYLRMSRHRKIGRDEDASCAIARCIEAAPERGA